jgi:hypothetical protein
MSAHPTPLRPGLPAPPPRLARRPIDARGFPVPFFVASIDGIPDHRVMDPDKLRDCVRFSLCSLCGEKLGAHTTFAIGPMCAVNRISADPPGHFECMDYAARACPFLTRPKAHRRIDEQTPWDDPTSTVGLPELRNPGVVLLWTSPYRVIRDPVGKRGVLFELRSPHGLQILAEGRTATETEVRASFESGVEILRITAEQEGPKAIAHLEALAATARALLGLPVALAGWRPDR